MLFEDLFTESFEDVVEFLVDLSVDLAGGGTINVLVNLSRYLCSNHGIQMSRKRWSCRSRSYHQILSLGEAGSSQGCSNRRINRNRHPFVEVRHCQLDLPLDCTNVYKFPHHIDEGVHLVILLSDRVVLASELFEESFIIAKSVAGEPLGRVVR